jgi:predicted restriction endonuclease
MIDARERVLSSIVRRRGQPAFRENLLTAYHGQCAITGCDVEDVLEAAHIVPYKGPETNHPGNGLLLRADMHTLFDLKRISVDVASMTLLVSPSLSGTCYEGYRGMQIKLPNDPGSQPSREALDQHRRESGL